MRLTALSGKDWGVMWPAAEEPETSEPFFLSSHALAVSRSSPFKNRALCRNRSLGCSVFAGMWLEAEKSLLKNLLFPPELM